MTAAQIAQTIRRVQELENSAADKAAVGCLALDESALTGTGAADYAHDWMERLLTAIRDEVLESARVGVAFLGKVADRPAGKSRVGSHHLAVFRAKVALLLTQYGDRLKIFVAENKVKGLSAAALKDQRTAEFSRWTLNRDALRKSIMREAGGLINSLYHAAYLEGLRPRGEA